MLNAVLFKSGNRFSAFKKKLDEYSVNCIVLDFTGQEWISYDFDHIDFIIYFSTFNYTSNHPLALLEVHDNLMYIHSKYPGIKMFPDPNIIRYYNDKYRQFLFLKGNDFPIPETIALLSDDSVELADQKLRYPMVIKNRYGAGGDSVFMVYSKKELSKYYNLSKMNFFNTPAARYFMAMLGNRDFYYYLIKEKKAAYPFLSPPILAQKFIKIDRDLKTVVGNYKVVEGHWRIRADENMWKMNIDGGGTGEWSYISDAAIELSIKLARKLNASWINLDLVQSDDEFLITEFSPVWHHYAYKEKPSFVYKDDYNIAPPLEVSLDLERIIVESLINAVSNRIEDKGE
jgi:glutathione synthase/RimK-type ligase-like ATP-grasp enzyme